MSELVFVKLGGSLITDKAKPLCARREVIASCAGAIAQALSDGTQLLLGHGSGSFGHPLAARYSTRRGVRSPSEWFGFAAVAHAARLLNVLVIGALLEQGVPAFPIPASALAIARGGELRSLDCRPLQEAWEAGLLPVTYGDVAFDDEWGGTIISTDQLFAFLAPRLRPHRIVLATDTDGVFEADPHRFPGAKRYQEIRAGECQAVLRQIGAASGPDVTGGMADKVRRMCELVRSMPGLRVQILSGHVPHVLAAAIMGRATEAGTTIVA